MSATDDVLANNARFAPAVSVRSPAPRLKLAVVACMDARIDLFRAFGLESGDALVIRNAGGIVSDDVLRSLFISQQALGTQEVMLVHHTHCALSGLDERALISRAERTGGAAPPFSLGAFETPEDDVRNG